MPPMPPCEVTVDRIEAAWAVVEWCGGDVVDVPAAILPPGVVEGDRFVVRMTRRSPAKRFFIRRNPSGTQQEHPNG